MTNIIISFSTNTSSHTILRWQRIFCLFSPVAFGNCKNRPHRGVFAFVDPGRARKGPEDDACLIPRSASAEGYPTAVRTSRAR